MTRCSVVRVVGSESFDSNAPDGDWHRISRVLTANHHEFEASSAGRFCKFCGRGFLESRSDD